MPVKSVENKVIESGILTGFLTICTIEDIRKRKIHSIWIWSFAGIGIFLYKIQGKLTIQELIGGVGIGILLLLIGKITKESIGYGDGGVLCTTGVYLGFWNNFSLLFWGSVFAAVYAVVLMLFCKKEKSETLPFLPFLLIAYVIKTIKLWL